MALYIEGIDAPKEGELICINLSSGGKCVVKSWHGSELNFAKLVPAINVPPHGELIDRNAVSLEGGPYDYDEWCKWALDQYQDAPTIIPANVDKEVSDQLKDVLEQI